MELKYIEAFLKVVEKGSFTLAADSMYISQPTISSRIQKLEQELDAVLFERNGGKKAILTSEGKKIYPFYKEGFRWILEGMDALATKGQGFGNIRLSCPNHIGDHILPNVLKSLYKNFPDVQFNVKVDHTSRIVEDIKKGETDIGLIYLDMKEENEFYTILPLVMEETVLVASPDHPFIERAPLNILELQEEKFIVFAKTANNTVLVDKFLNKHGLREYQMIEIQNLEWIKNMVKNGLGIAFLQKNIVEADLKAGELKELILSHPLPITPISIIFRNNIPAEIRYAISKTVKELFVG